jgi:RecB family endonuclease NucS
MPSEKDLETVLAKYPELIEENLRLLGRQVTVHGRRMDLLFEDQVGRRLIIELKWGPIKDAHIGQIMCYEGSLLSNDDPRVRVMLIGTRVPPNLGRSLDHHGIAWKEITSGRIASFLRTKNDRELSSIFEETLIADIKLSLPAEPRPSQPRFTVPPEAPEVLTPDENGGIIPGARRG